MKLKIRKTQRGFPFAEFKDRYNKDCSISKSSLAFEDCIWLGCDRIELKEMTENGWKDYPEFDELTEKYVANTRMHLTRQQVKALLPLLQNFVETGEIQYQKVEK